MTAKATFRFKVRVAAKDPEGYYITKWGEATPVTVFAHDADEAMRKARSSMGEPPWNKQWAVMIDGADEERVDIKHADLANRLRAASADKALSIGEAWELLDEAADALEGVAREGRDAES